MRILMINHFPLEGSGSGTYTKNLAMQLVSMGHEVCVIMPENTVDFPRYDGVRFHPVYFTGEGSAPADALPFNFPCFTTHPRSLVAFGDLDEVQLNSYIQAFRAAIEDEIVQFKPDVVHGQHVWILSSLAVGCGVPLVLTAHGTDLMGVRSWPNLRPFAERAIDACSCVICVSKDNEQLVREIFPEAAHKLVLMSNGYNPAIFKPLGLDASEVLAPYGVDVEGRRIVLFAGKLTNFKGVDVLLNAAARYELQAPDVVTVLAGDGELREELEAQAHSLGLQRVHFLGNVAQDELCRLYNIADVDLVPSRREAFGLVAVEAMACGTPVVATNEGGLPDFVNDQVGALVPVNDAQALADAILDTLERASADWRADIASYARAYSQEAVISELVPLYQQAIEQFR